MEAMMNAVFQKGKGQGGFTLIELLVVIAIIGMLVSIAIPQITIYKKKGYRADLQANLRNAFSAAQGYISDVPSVTITTEAVLNRYGFKRSSSISFGSVDLSPISGQITLAHEGLPSEARTGTVDYQGVITLPAQ